MKSEAKRIKRGWMNLEVRAIERETHDCCTLHLIDREEQQRAFDYEAGQYLTFRFDHVSERPVVRSYTMSSSPCQPEDVAITVKEVANGFISLHLCREVKVGDILRARGAIGKFCFDPAKDHKNLVMVAAGSGVTPFVSIMRQYAPYLGSEGAPATMTLLVAYRSQQDLINWPVLQELKNIPGIKVMTTLSREHAEDEGFYYGRISPEHIDTAVEGRYEETTFMTCGPEEMMQITVAHVLGAGVDAAHMKTESFAS